MNLGSDIATIYLYYLSYHSSTSPHQIHNSPCFREGRMKKKIFPDSWPHRAGMVSSLTLPFGCSWLDSMGRSRAVEEEKRNQELLADSKTAEHEGGLEEYQGERVLKTCRVKNN